VLAWDESSEFTSYEDVTHDNKNALEAAKKELSENKPVSDIKAQVVGPAKDEKEPIQYPTSETKNEPSVKTAEFKAA
jgi:hypothetical protein